MLCFPNCKINLGLSITGRFQDGYHRIETVIYPLALSDMLEIVPATSGGDSFVVSGLPVDGPVNDNLCYKAWKIIHETYRTGPVKLHLHKIIPSGAGLGGGSSDAAFTLKMLNTIHNLGLDNQALSGFASRLGMDCPFFISNRPAMATGRGEVLENIELNLSGMHLVLVKPAIHISTAEAYAGVTPTEKQARLPEILSEPVASWRSLLINDFELSVFRRYPQIKVIKEKLYDAGAVYAAMSGSGSAVFGLFENRPAVSNMFPGCFTWEEVL